jgi:hypothetical protein
LLFWPARLEAGDAIQANGRIMRHARRKLRAATGEHLTLAYVDQDYIGEQPDTVSAVHRPCGASSSCRAAGSSSGPSPGPRANTNGCLDGAA